jgi:hypothetical protein
MESDVSVGRLLADLHNATITMHRRPASAQATDETSYVIVPPVDAVFVLGQGAAMYYVDGSASVLQKSDGERVAGWVHIESPDAVLSELLLWLNTSMPRVHRYHAIGINYLTGARKFVTLEQVADVKDHANAVDETASQ